MAIRSEDQAVEQIGQWFEHLYDCVILGVRDYYEHYKHVAAVHRPTTRRSIMRDHIVDRVRAALSEERGIELVRRYGTMFVGMASRYLVKVHMLNEKMAIALNDTTHALNFQGNAPQTSLGEGFEPATALYLGYVQSLNDPLNPRVFLVCPNGGGKPYWARELKRQGGAIVLDAPNPFTPRLDEEDLVEVRQAPDVKTEDDK